MPTRQAHVARRGADAVEWYRRMLAERPIAANAVTCGTLYAAGDGIAQHLERGPGQSGRPPADDPQHELGVAGVGAELHALRE